jgi:hypothetical protein
MNSFDPNLAKQVNSQGNYGGLRIEGVLPDDMRESEQATRYLNRVARPLVEQGFHVSVHHPSEWRNRDTGIMEEGVPGLAFTDLNAALNHALAVPYDHSLAKAHFKNVYLAMGGEITTKAAYGAKIIANRRQGNVGASSALWMDVDVKPDDPAAYASEDEMTPAFGQFLTQSGMPFPNLIVNSGQGGKHLYWLLDRLLDPDEWTPLATKLINAANAASFKIDAKCTRDICRLLRVPGTLNFKTNPPKPVKLIYDDGDTCSVEHLTQILTRFKSNSRSKSRSRATPDDGDDFDAKDLMRGVNEYPPADIDEVAKHCPAIAHTLATGGLDLTSEPQWHAHAALSCHCIEPSKTLHRLTKKNQYYSREGAEDKLRIAQEARRADPNVGPPGCEHMRYVGMPQCGLCPHLALKSNPINITPCAINTPLVGGRALVTTLLPKVLQDLPGKREYIVQALDF